MPTDLWYVDSDYAKTINEAFDNLENEIYEFSWEFTHQQVLDTQEYVETHGFGNSEEKDALQKYYDKYYAESQNISDNLPERCDRDKHNYTEATCSSPRTCTNCGKVIGSPKEHNYVFVSCTTPYKCEWCGKEKEGIAGHDYTKETCTRGSYCRICGKDKSNSKPLGHHYAPATCLEASYCTRCGLTKGSALGHDFNIAKANCTTKKYCKRCNHVEQNALGHNYNVSAANCTTAKKCTRCNYVAQNALGHICNNPNYAYNETYHIYGYCNRCGCEMINRTTAGNTRHNLQTKTWYSKYNIHLMDIGPCTGCSYEGILYNYWQLCPCPQEYFTQSIIERGPNYVKVRVGCRRCHASQEDYLYPEPYNPYE